MAVKGTKGGKLGTALRQGYQGLTLGFGDEGIDAYGALLASALTGEKPFSNYKELYKEARALTKEDLAEDSQNAPGLSMTANIAGSLVPGIVAGPKLLAQTALGAISGVGSDNGDLSDRAFSGVVGGGLGAAGQAVGNTIGRVAKGASDKISPAVRETAKKLKEMGIPVRLSQLVDSKFLSAIDTALSKVPFSGANKSQEAQRKAFTKALSNTFGEDADTIDSAILGSAKERLGGAYNKLLGDKDIPIDRKAFAQGISQLVDDLSLENDDAGAAFLQKQAENILGTIDNNGGKLTGKSYQKLRQTLKGAKGTNYSAGQLQKFLDDSVRQSVPDNIASELGGIDKQYRNMKITEKLFGQLQNSSGQIKPETLYNAAKPSIGDLAYGGGGELGDLARSGRLLKPTVPDSGTATQLIGLGALGAAGYGSYQDPSASLPAIGTIGAAALLNKGMSSKYLQEGLSPMIQKGASAIQNSGVIPGLLRSGQQQFNTEQPSQPAQQDPFADLQSQDDPFADLVPQGSQPPQDDPFSDLVPQQEGSAAPLLDKIRMAESGGDVNARNPNSSASGAYQFTDPTWKGMVKNYGAQTGITEADKNNPTAQQKMAELLTQENTNMYKQAGIEPNDKDIYLAHFLGGPSAVKAKKALGTGAYGEQLFPQAAKANKNIFYKGGRPRTVDEIYNILGAKVS